MSTTAPYPSLGVKDDLVRRDATCTKCEKPKRPTRAYMALLKSRDLRYVCQACRESAPPPTMSLGKLGAI